MKRFEWIVLLGTIGGCGHGTGTSQDLAMSNDMAVAGDLATSPDLAASGGGDMATTGGVDLAGVDLAGRAPLTGNFGSGSSSGVTPVAGATVEVVGASPANSTTTATDGTFTLLIASDADQTVRFTSTGKVTVQVDVHISAGGGGSLQINTLSQTDFDALVTAGGATPNAAKGNVIVFFNGAATTGGYGATLSAAHDTGFTITAIGAAMQSDVTIASGFLQVTYPNVAPGTSTDTPVVPNGKSCTSPFPVATHRIDANVLTALFYNCT